MAFARAKQDRLGRPPDRSAPGVSRIFSPQARASCEGSLPLVRTFPSCCSSAVRTAPVGSGFSLAVVFLTYDKPPRRSAAGRAVAPNPRFGQLSRGQLHGLFANKAVQMRCTPFAFATESK